MNTSSLSSQGVSELISNPFLYPATLAMHLWPSGSGAWLPGRHLLLASAKIAHAVRRGNGRLIISMPPRHGKSRLVSETTVPWFLEEFPGKHVILTSYNADKASEFGRKARDMIISRPDLFSCRVRRDVKRTDYFETESGSEASFVGLGGTITGKGAHLLIIDDFLKNIQEALSPAHREKQWMSFLADVDSRLEPDATIIIVATRWHSDDIIGRILSRLEGWEYICMPALATDADDPLGRAIGEPLFPERYGLKRLTEIKNARAGTFLFESLYQQRPIDDINQLTNGDWLRVVQDISPDVERSMTRVRAWDLASTEGGGDWTVGPLLGRYPSTNSCTILNLMRKQYSPAQVEQLVRRTAEADGPDVTILIEQEPGSAGKALVQHYITNVLHGFNVIAVPTQGISKVARAMPFIAAAEFGRISMIQASWNEELVHEFDHFPSGDHDDIVDTLSMGYNHLFATTEMPVAWGRDEVIGEPYSVPVNSLDSPEQRVDGSRLITGLTW